MVLKTRDKLIEVARRLFAHKGVEKTTMNDIAEASEKGRRTIYTYFKNKDEIYDAIIEKESDDLLAKLREVVSMDLAPADKLERYLRVRFEFLAGMAPARDYLTLLFSQEARRWRKVRRMSIAKEKRLFQEMIDEGVASGRFDAAQATRLSVLESIMVQAVNMAHFRGHIDEFGVTVNEVKEKLIEFIINGVACPQTGRALPLI